MESRLTESCEPGLQRRQFDEQRKTLEQKNKKYLIEQSLMHVKKAIRGKSKDKKKLNLNGSVPFSQTEARDILAQTEENLTKEIASRIREAEQEVKERSDKTQHGF